MTHSLLRLGLVGAIGVAVAALSAFSFGAFNPGVSSLSIAGVFLLKLYPFSIFLSRSIVMVCLAGIFALSLFLNSAHLLAPAFPWPATPGEQRVAFIGIYATLAGTTTPLSLFTSGWLLYLAIRFVVGRARWTTRSLEQR